MNEEDIRFINSWEKYRGFPGAVKYLLPFFLLGMIASPIILTLINANIWKQLRESKGSSAFLPVVSLCLVFSVLPAVTIGILIWKKTNRQYKLLTTDGKNYKNVKELSWNRKDRIWSNTIRYGSYLAAFMAVFSFGLLLSYNAPPYHSYPFITCCALIAFCALYKIAQPLFIRLYNGAQTVPGVVKIIFVVLCAVVLLSWLNLFFIKMTI